MSSQFIHARQVYPAQRIYVGHEYVDLHSFDENGMRHVDYSRIDETQPIQSSAEAQ